MPHTSDFIAPDGGSFHDNPVVYHIVTDRFCNPARAQGLTRVAGDAHDAIGTFHGGTLAGIVQKIEAEWFCALGVNAILISAPYEQIRGWVPGGGAPDGSGGFRHYAYHGYYALDYTVMDERFGTMQDLKNLVDAAHRRGIRVLLDVVLNHPGYPDLDTMRALDLPVGCARAGNMRPPPITTITSTRKATASPAGGARTGSGPTARAIPPAAPTT